MSVSFPTPLDAQKELTPGVWVDVIGVPDAASFGTLQFVASNDGSTEATVRVAIAKTGTQPAAFQTIEPGAKLDPKGTYRLFGKQLLAGKTLFLRTDVTGVMVTADVLYHEKPVA